VEDWWEDPIQVSLEHCRLALSGRAALKLRGQMIPSDWALMSTLPAVAQPFNR